MRQISHHKLSGGLNEAIQVTALDEPGRGGACCEYLIDGVKGPLDHHPIKPVSISFQNGSPQEVGANGITNEALLTVLIDRLNGFQSGEFACRENAVALNNLHNALMWLQHRTIVRTRMGIEGTHQA